MAAPLPVCTFFENGNVWLTSVIRGRACTVLPPPWGDCDVSLKSTLWEIFPDLASKPVVSLTFCPCFASNFWFYSLLNALDLLFSTLPYFQPQALHRTPKTLSPGACLDQSWYLDHFQNQGPILCPVVGHCTLLCITAASHRTAELNWSHVASPSLFYTVHWLRKIAELSPILPQADST